MTAPANPAPALSVIVPAYDAADTIGAALASVFAAPAPEGGIEVIVVDDGSNDADRLRSVLAAYPAVRLLAHAANRGMCAARNTGIAASTGRIVTVLDADDTLVPDWPASFARILAEWPAQAGLCFAGCRTPSGEPTRRVPDYRGPLSLATFLSDRYAGEYLPLFRGDYVRAAPYVDLGTRKSCGNLSYLRWLQDGPIHVTAEELRIYDTGRAGSVSANWARADKAAESARCVEAEIARYEALFRANAPGLVEKKQLKLAVYRRLAGLPGAWRAFAAGWGLARLPDTLAALAMLLAGPRVATALVNFAKRANLIKRYG